MPRFRLAANPQVTTNGLSVSHRVETDGQTLMGGQRFPDGSPTAIITLGLQAMLDAVQQMIGQNRNEQMGVGTRFFLMKDRTQPQIGFQVTEQSRSVVRHFVGNIAIN